jgi:mRNA interferase MazF
MADIDDAARMHRPRRPPARRDSLAAAIQAAIRAPESSPSLFRVPRTCVSTSAGLGRGVVTVVPVTSNIRRVFPFQALLPAAATGLPQDSKAQAEQVRSVAVDRVGGRIGVVPPRLMEQVDEALRVHLAL